MSQKPLPLKPLELDRIMGYLLRLSETSESEIVRRLAKSLFSVLSRDRVREIEY